MELKRRREGWWGWWRSWKKNNSNYKDNDDDDDALPVAVDDEMQVDKKDKRKEVESGEEGKELRNTGN